MKIKELVKHTTLDVAAGVGGLFSGEVISMFTNPVFRDIIFHNPALIISSFVGGGITLGGAVYIAQKETHMPSKDNLMRLGIDATAAAGGAATAEASLFLGDPAVREFLLQNPLLLGLGAIGFAVCFGGVIIGGRRDQERLQPDLK